MLVGGAAATGALALAALPAAGQSAPDPATPVHPEGRARDFGFDPPSTASPDRRIMFPVLGKVSWTDTYLAARGSGRRHEGQDLMGTKMLKILACADGTVVELRHGSDGNSLYLQDAQGWYYAYLHINNDTPGTDDGKNPIQYAFAPGLTRGSKVRKGQHLAYVGDSGNAESAGSHLHFEIRQPHSGGLWRSSAVNPKVSLQNAEPAQESSVPPETFEPWDNSPDLIAQQYRDLLGREPSGVELLMWADKLNRGEWTPQKFIEFVLNSSECQERVHSVTRLYQAYFLRRPDQPGFAYWVGQRRSGASLSWIASFFAASSEFTARYGALDDVDFVDLVYRNVLGRPPDDVGLLYWVSKLSDGASRGWVMMHFSESPENKAKTATASLIVGGYGTMLQRMPTDADIGFWSERTTTSFVNGIRLSPEYAGRVT